MTRSGWQPTSNRLAGAATALSGLLFAGLILLGAAASPAAAASSSPRLSLTARSAAGHSPAIVLLATLKEAARSPGHKATLRGLTVTFSVHLEEFSGAPLLVLGSATTNSAGEARFTYKPTFAGRQALVAAAADSAGNTVASATTSYVAAGAVHPLARMAEAARPDGAIGKAVVGVLLAIVVLLWIVLVSVVVRARRGVVTART